MSNYKLDEFKVDKNDLEWCVYDDESMENDYKVISINVLSGSRNINMPKALRELIERSASYLLSRNQILVQDVLVLARLCREYRNTQGTSDKCLHVEIYIHREDYSDMEFDYKNLKIQPNNKLYEPLKQYFNNELNKLLFS